MKMIRNFNDTIFVELDEDNKRDDGRLNGYAYMRLHSRTRYEFIGVPVAMSIKEFNDIVMKCSIEIDQYIRTSARPFILDEDEVQSIRDLECLEQINK
jgi:hypothetical protein